MSTRAPLMAEHALARRSAAAAILLAALAISCGPGKARPEARVSGTIVFAGTEEGDTEIFAMRADGTGLVQLTENSVSDEEPRWSPDGSRIAYVERVGRYTQVFVMNSDGSAPTQVTSHPFHARNPTWSPNGLSLAYVGLPERYDIPQAHLFVIKPDGSNGRRLDPDVASRITYPDWSRDGHLVGTGQEGLVDLDIAANKIKQSLEGYAIESARISPSDDRITFAGERVGELLDFDLYVVANFGAAPKQLTDTSEIDSFPAWSPDGEHIVFSRQEVESDEAHLFLLTVDSGELVQLTTGASMNLTPDWTAAEVLPGA